MPQLINLGLSHTRSCKKTSNFFQWCVPPFIRCRCPWLNKV